MQSAKQHVQDGPYVFMNQELHHVSFVGVIRNVADNTSNVTLTVEDGTGQIEFRKWTNDSNDMSHASQGEPNDEYNSQVAQDYSVGKYIKVYASLREFSGKMNVQYAVVKKIETFNEVLAHHLEVMKAFATMNGTLSTGGAESSNTINADGNGLFVQDNEPPKSATEKVLDFIRAQCAGKDSNSFSVQTKLIAQSLNMLEDDVRMYCQTLTEQGYIYPTFDEFTFFIL
ncbi:replication factor A protein 2 [Kluyveromyces marxianus]|nr:replication factor A protein 2 [Kluyveromyces marxianus]